VSQRNWSPDIVEIGGRIATLTPAQASLLNQYLADIHGIEVAAVTTSLQPEPDIIVTDDRVEPTDFDVVLDGYDKNHKITLIRTIRGELGLGLKEAVDLVQTTPRTIRERLPRSEAETLQARLESAGARVSLRPCLQ
jgi:large subunit ribosomal protein L7/L12